MEGRIQKPAGAPSHSPGTSGKPNIIPRHFVWRLNGGRHSSSHASHTIGGGEMGVDVPVLRDVFDPWRSKDHDDEDGCDACRKMDETRAVNSSQESLPTLESEAASSITSIQSATMRHTLHRELDDGCPESAPEQIHELKHDCSVLTLAVSDDYIFAGTQNGEIIVWSLNSYEVVQHIQAHKRSVLCLFLSADGQYLLSSACEPIINVWCPRTFARLYEIYSTYNVGDVFSIAYSAQHQTVYMGTQTQYIQWVDLKDAKRTVTQDSVQHPDRRQHRFFDSRAVGGTSTPRRMEERWGLIPRAEHVLEVDAGAIKEYAHYGWVHCMLVAKGPTVFVEPDEEVLISGGGDGTIKLWKLLENGPDHDHGENVRGDIEEIMCLGEESAESIVSLAIDGSFLYSGKRYEGTIELWDLDTKQKLRVIKAHDGDVMALQMSFGLLWSASTTGNASKHSTVHYGRDTNGAAENVSQKYNCLSRWQAHNGKILASSVTTHQGDQLYITGGNDNKVCVWRVNGMPDPMEEAAENTEDMMITSLREFVAYKTISSRPEYTEDCRKGATFLGTLFKRLGAQVEMLSIDRLYNPVVFAKFSGKLEPPSKRKRILFYGHYDVVPADNKGDKWRTDPFRMDGVSGYLYGRGVTDNKGPIMAALYAVTDLLQAKALDSDIVFLIEGEEESGSRGFQDTVHKHKDLIGSIDYIIIANSYWLDDETPCLTYGLRGVLHASVCVDSKHPDLHSGVDGSYIMSEPTTDLTLLLAQLKNRKNHVNIPDFYKSIVPATEEEEARYNDITDILIRRNPENGPPEALKRSLMARWREPNLTIHRMNVSGPEGSLISSHATANVSIRLVPGQDVEEVIESMEAFLRDEFAKFESENVLTIRIDNKAEPWLGVPGNYIFRTLEDAVIKAWGLDRQDSDTSNGNGKATKHRKPLYIREGGSIPAIRFLEKEFGAPAAHLPCGQATDSAHLDNERLRITNLLKSREIFGTVFRKL